MQIKLGLLILLSTFLTGYFVVLSILCVERSHMFFDPSDSSTEGLHCIPQATGPGNLNIDTAFLCEHLRDIKTIPYDPNEETDDPIYNGLRSAGDKAIPCLIEKITDTERIPSPKEMMPINDFRVGDAAVYMLMYNTQKGWDPTTMFPPKYQKLFKSDGVFAYYAYVENPANRKKYQLWWKNWMLKRGASNVQP